MSLENNPSPFAEPTGNSGEIDVDSLMSSIESGQPTERAMTETSPAATTPQTPPSQTAQDIEFNWNGRTIKAPLDKLKVYAQQGYDYAQKISAFKQDRSKFDLERKSAQEMAARYKEVEDYVQKNPEWWTHVNEQYKSKTTGADPNSPVFQKLQSVENKLSEAEEFIKSVKDERAQARISQEDTALDSEIKSIRSEEKDLDWSTKDAEGKDLEYRILEHANAIGTKSFRAAFRDFYHDQLVKRAAERAKEGLVKDRQKQTKLGLLGQTPTPKKGITEAQDIKNKSYDQLLREGLEEYGAGA